MFNLILKLLILISFLYLKYYKIKYEKNISYFRNNKVDLITKNIFKKYNIINTNNINNTILFIPKTYTFYKNDFKLYNLNKIKYIYVLNGCDLIAGKNNLYYILKKSYNNEILNKLIPKTWLIQNNMNLFKKKFNSNNIYILKNNKQQKKGIYLSNNLKEILNIKSNYCVIQKYINNTFLINYRKVNLRLYLLIVYQNNQLNFYIHKNGKCLYSNNKFNSKSDLNNLNNFITTSSNNLDKKHYNNNPLTLDDLKIYLYKKNLNYDKLFRNIINNLKIILYPFKKILLKKNIKFTNTLFQLFGIDYIFNNNLDVFLLEINKGPNMNIQLKNDYKLKFEVIEDTFNIIGLIKKNKNNYIKIL